MMVHRKKEEELTHSLQRIVEVLSNNKHGCKQEAINIALDVLGNVVEHNSLREYLNSTKEDYHHS
ncbi:hypothetical protein [Rheinheimera sp. UJ63]|uniref:hypothetical protein n=1 Tax=Rheinheimera sp. UJ63 TaxID=2910157 RepID=UPI001F1E386C|nr:hypothetical protein [Rheinheimera sp. UJ63]MCF4010624.1 hypothetical protein [Rheinheimera sp. UJ63]